MTGMRTLAATLRRALATGALAAALATTVHDAAGEAVAGRIKVLPHATVAGEIAEQGVDGREVEPIAMMLGQQRQRRHVAGVDRQRLGGGLHARRVVVPGELRPRHEEVSDGILGRAGEVFGERADGALDARVVGHAQQRVDAP